MAPRWGGIWWLAAWACLVVGCGGGATAESIEVDRRPLFVCTTAMVGDLVHQVAGDRARVVSLIGTGVDPHLFTPTRSHLKLLLAADVVCVNGLHLEGRLTRTIDDLRQSGRAVWQLSDALPDDRVLHKDDSLSHDPHIWLDVSLWATATAWIEQQCSEFDPSHAEEYRTRADAYRRQLIDLDAYVARVIASIPEPQRALATSHDAFGYFSARYGIDLLPLQGISTESEAGVHDVTRLTEEIGRRRLPAIFSETSVNSKTVIAVIEAARARGLDVKLGGELYSDAMGAAGTYEGTYLGMIDANATRMARALGGDVPSGGWSGRIPQ